MKWYPRSTADKDTHRGTLSRGMVDATCGIQFRPLPAFGGSALVAEPPDPRQVCTHCRNRTRHVELATTPNLSGGLGHVDPPPDPGVCAECQESAT